MGHAVKWLIVADDLTGAADSASPFALAGLSTVVALGMVGPLPECEVLAVDTDGRRLPPEPARSAIADAFRSLSALHNFLKIDSTLRGSIGAMVEGAFQGSKRRWGVFCSAVPSQGRRVRSGRVTVYGSPISQTPFASMTDPPIVSDSLADRLSATGLKTVAILSLAGLAQAQPDGVIAQIADAERKGCLVVCDAEDDQEIRTLVDFCSRLPTPPLWIGALGLASALARPPQLCCRRNDGPPVEGVLIVCGSRHPVARGQLERFGSSGFPVTTLDALDRWLIRRHCAAAVTVDLAEGFSHEHKGKLETVAEVLSSGRMALVLIGGDTARSVLSSINIWHWRLTGALEPGFPVGVALIGSVPLTIATRAGGFGDRDSLVRAVRHLLP